MSWQEKLSWHWQKASLRLRCLMPNHPFTCRSCHTASRRRSFTTTVGLGFSPSVWCIRTLDHHSQRDVSPDLSCYQNLMSQKLWREFFCDPCQWWDNRSEKVNPRYPDFKHKKTGQSLWLDNSLTPLWVEAELATMAPGLLQSHSFSWNVRLKRHAEAQDYTKILSLFQQMQREGVMPDKFTFVQVLKACSRLRYLEEGRRVHQQIIQRGCESEIYVANSLIYMYANCGSTEDAWRVFNRMPERDVVSWNTMIGGYVKTEQGLKSLELFRNMYREGVEPNTVSFVGALNACASIADLEEGRRVHKEIIRNGWQSDVHVASCLVDMYAKCGSIKDAWSVFHKMQERTVVSWTAMIGGYVEAEEVLKALELFKNMCRQGVKPNTVTFVGALNACARLAALEEGRSVHKQIILRGCESDVYVANCLVDMYAKCGSIEDACSVFNMMQERDVVSWNAMIGGYVKSGQALQALKLFRKMQQEGLEPNTVTFLGMLNACASLATLQEGWRVHEQIIQKGFESDVYVANRLVDMYVKCGSMEDAWSVFNRMRGRTVVSWNILIGGYVKSEQELKALELFQEMQRDGVEPDTVTFVGALNACAGFVTLQQGRRVHKQIICRGYDSDSYVATCLVDMYAKCGSTKDARTVFNKIRERDVVSWNAMIGGYAIHGQFKKALKCFERMDKENVEVNQITFICLLSACSHGGLVEEGLRYFNTMTSHYNILPTREHYGCMVDLLGRAGRLEEAEEKAGEMMKRTSSDRHSCVWMTLLGACRIHGNIEMAERAAKWCWELDPENGSANVLLSNIYAAAGKWDRSAAIDEGRLKIKVWKVPGRTWIEVKNVVYSFAVDDKKHLEILSIWAEFDSLSVHLNEEGYTLDRRFLSPEEEEEGCHLCRNCEKLDIAYGVISILHDSPLVIRKNLRLYPECHSATKFQHKMVGRVIIVKDVEIFEGGICSCNNCLVNVGGNRVFHCQHSATLQYWIFGRDLLERRGKIE